MPPPHQLGVSGSAISSPSGVCGRAAEVGFGVFLGFRNHQCLFTTHNSPVIVLLSLGVADIGQVMGSNHSRGGPSQSTLD